MIKKLEHSYRFREVGAVVEVSIFFGEEEIYKQIVSDITVAVLVLAMAAELRKAYEKVLEDYLINGADADKYST